MAFQMRMSRSNQQPYPPEDGWFAALQTGLRSRGGGALLLSATIALAAVPFPAETTAQSGKTPAAKTKVDPKELYGDQGGEKVGVANARAPNTVMRARLEDTFLKVSNPRVEQTPKKFNILLIDYEVVSRGKLDGGFLVLHTDDGGKAEVELKSIKGRDSGTIELGGVQWFGNIRIAKNTKFPDNIEFYVVRSDDRYDPPLKCMVSNSSIMGKIKVITRPRDWTPDEIERYHVKPPLAYKNPNANPDVGEDVPPLPAAGGQFRFVDPDGRLLGLDFDTGDWDNRKVIARMKPVFNADQPKTYSTRSIARKGFAVAGADVNVDKYICGIRLLFRRVKPDGTFDAKDSYSGEWLGVPPKVKGEEAKLVNDGRRVMGIHYQQGAIVDRFSLVAEVAEKAK